MLLRRREELRQLVYIIFCVIRVSVFYWWTCEVVTTSARRTSRRLTASTFQRTAYSSGWFCVVVIASLGPLGIMKLVLVISPATTFVHYFLSSVIWNSTCYYLSVLGGTQRVKTLPTLTMCADVSGTSVVIPYWDSCSGFSHCSVCPC